VEGENERLGKHFVGYQRRTISESESMTLTSNHKKGLFDAEEFIGDGVARVVCSFRLNENFCKLFTTGLKLYLWQSITKSAL